jgi:hypothetical protein
VAARGFGFACAADVMVLCRIRALAGCGGVLGVRAGTACRAPTHVSCGLRVLLEIFWAVIVDS